MNEMQKQLEQIAALLHDQTTLSLATSGEDGEPCIAPLFYIVDEQLTLYWLSSESSLHSRNLIRSPRAAATVYSSAHTWKEIRGVQMRGLVSQVTEPVRRRALVKAYCARFKLGRVFRLAIQQSTLFALQPEFIRYIDNARGFGCKFELTRQAEGWTSTRPVA
jgi:uncharacterized protein YhbP (UPF0306 family)